MTVQEVAQVIDEVLDSDELYDLLPGDGEDDYIISQLRRMFKEKLEQLEVKFAEA